jgi:hypothetical protein
MYTMPLENDCYVPWGRERYHFHPWYERPMTERQMRVGARACTALVAVLTIAAGVGLWLTGWPNRWLAEPVLACLLIVLAVWARDEVREPSQPTTSQPISPSWADILAGLPSPEPAAPAEPVPVVRPARPARPQRRPASRTRR